jgi:hypothetical protein
LAADISEALRRLVAERAGYRCEYCLLHEEDSYSPHQVDHIISRKHGEESQADNLAFACLRCNAWKGSDIGSLDSQTGRFVNLFHPRRQRWEDHFVLRGAIIEPLTAEGRATARLLKLNLDKRVVERKLPIAAGCYPS